MKKTLIALALATAGLSAAHAQTVVKIGHAGPLTGPIAHIGKDGENGVRLAIEDANAKGTTIGGQKVKFELLSEDDQADPRTATTVAQRLTDAGVKGVVGHVTSGASIPASRIYEQAGVPVITPSSTNPKLTQQGYKVTFRVIANDLQQGAAMATYANKLGAKKVAIIDDRTAYGQGLADAFAESLKKEGVQVVGREFTNDKATDFTAILTKIKGKQPDAVFFGGMDAQAAPMLRQMKQLGLGAKFLGGDGACTGEMIKLAGDAMSGDAYCTQAGIPMDKMPGGAAFNKRFKEVYKGDVQLYAPYSYDAAMALIEAMKAAGSVEPGKYLPALQKLSVPGVTGKIAFDKNGDILDGGVTLYQFKGGKWEALN
ncbi:branched-chain amino acid ABC transporter substrate-binding protein [Aromatoleum evansii]|uniref:Branched-chain amino acid ABC transporter substrate-binding protein n=1 Tax=Aromatoleum evansii TaxID=59406 RepID=A0ABZ1AMQ2_AROEV|nr:branched-chain amino acid ABC transporter substrate-binding protein [Aromatoleum evansii]NMG29369.1 ABC transporter substrate-binding protein [Aromatoleum evansii]WRL46204.1 branched-chain amino acid ABC transporter substrate-binding protein [Aromatoleum evansii]